MTARKASSSRKAARAGRGAPKAKAVAVAIKSGKSAKSPKNGKTSAPAKRARKVATASVSAGGKPKKAAPGEESWTLRLYVTGRGERSETALRNLRRLCEQSLSEGSYQIEVIDLMKHPELAKADEIIAIPTLVRKLPEPMKRIIGDLSNGDRALLSLDLPLLGASKAKRSPEANA